MDGAHHNRILFEVTILRMIKPIIARKGIHHAARERGRGYRTVSSDDRSLAASVPKNDASITRYAKAESEGVIQNAEQVNVGQQQINVSKEKLLRKA